MLTESCRRLVLKWYKEKSNPNSQKQWYNQISICQDNYRFKVFAWSGKQIVVVATIMLNEACISLFLV